MKPEETREMRVFSRLLQVTEDETLAQFIARRRMPGDGWKTWDEIMVDLAKATGEIVNQVSLRKWAKRYGIFEFTQRDGKGQTPTAEYVKQLKRAGIDLGR